MTKDKCCEILVNSASSASSQIHVLAVDDCIIDRKIIHKLLKMVFYKVTVVESAAEVLELLGINVDGDRPTNSDCINEKKVNMIITDYCMPGISGYDLLKKLKETKGLKEIPVVMMSSEDVPERVKRCLAEGAEDFITKPLQIGDIKKLRSHIKPARPVCYSAAKRKVPSRRVRLTGKSVERRPRLSGVVSA